MNSTFLHVHDIKFCPFDSPFNFLDSWCADTYHSRWFVFLAMPINICIHLYVSSIPFFHLYKFSHCEISFISAYSTIIVMLKDLSQNTWLYLNCLQVLSQMIHRHLQHIKSKVNFPSFLLRSITVWWLIKSLVLELHSPKLSHHLLVYYHLEQAFNFSGPQLLYLQRAERIALTS